VDVDADVVALLRRMGVEVWMLTGDEIMAANAVAKQATIKPANVLASLLPADKAQKIKSMQDEGDVVAMVRVQNGLVLNPLTPSCLES
jgi:Cu+-exporting ATPase